MSEKKVSQKENINYIEIEYIKYIYLIDLVNKKSEKLTNIKQNKKLIDIIENNDINTLLQSLDIIASKNKINIKKEKNDIRNILYSLSAEIRIKKLICSILWLIENFKKYIKFNLTSFNDYIVNMYKAFEKKTITISILIDCINFLKSKNIIEDDISNINKDLFIDFLLLINNQFRKKNKNNAVHFCLNKKEHEIEDIINNIKNSDINFLNLNDINDFKSCFFFMNDLFKEKIDIDLTLLLKLKLLFNKDVNIYYKFKNYFRYYKNIDLLYKEISLNKPFNGIVEEFFKESELIIKCDMVYDVLCDIIICNKEKKTFDEIYEMKEMFLINYKQDKTNKDKFIKFYDIIDNIKKLIDNLFSLYQLGYPFHKEFYIKIDNGNVTYKKDVNKEFYYDMNISDVIKKINEINIAFKKSQISFFEKSPMLSFIYGKIYPFLLSNYIKKEKNINLDKKVRNILKFISNNMIKNVLNKFEYSQDKIKNQDLNYFFESLIKYIELTFELNNTSLEMILKNNFISDEFNYIKGGIYYIEYKLENLEYNILNIYQEITGNYPINNTILICSKDTKFEKIYSFLFSAFLCEYPVLFMLLNLEIFSLSFKYKVILLIIKLSKIYNKRKSALIILGQDEIDNNNNEINMRRKINEISENKMIMLEKKDEKNIKYKYNNVKIYLSQKSGLGLSSYIKYNILYEMKKEYIYFPIGGIFSRRQIMERLRNLNIEENENCVIHIDINQTNLISLLKDFLFKILILKFYDYNNDIFYLGDNIKIILELHSDFINYISLIPFLSFFDINYIDKIYPLRISQEKKVEKIKDTNIQIVVNTLLNYYKSYIHKINIDLDSEKLLTEEDCENVLDTFYQVHEIRQNYYQREMLIKFLGVQFKHFAKCPYLTISEFTAENFENVVKARPKIIEAIINTGKLLVSSPFEELIKIQKESFDEKSENKLKENIDMINYESIKDCLFFFNEDEETFTVITNNYENEESKLFYSLYNIHNIYGNDNETLFKERRKKLIKYNNLTHEEYINELKNILNIEQKIDINELAKKNGNYVFTRDNFIKMIFIYLRIKSNIPVILMGETGCGKTSLIKMLSLIIHKGEDKLKIMNINEGTIDQDIINFIKKCENEIKHDEKMWIFFDEINTCESLGLLSEIILKQTVLGKKLKKNFVFIGSCNPYRKITEKMKESGLILLEEKEKKFFLNKNNLVYKVNPLPTCLINYIFNFGSLSSDEEKKYASSIIQFYFNKIEKFDKHSQKIKIYDLILISTEKLTEEKKTIVDILIFSNKYMKNIYDNSSISLRDIKRFTIFYDWFLKYLINESPHSDTYRSNSDILLKDCLKLTIYLCYYLRISNPLYRQDFSKKIGYELENNFLEVPLREEKYITEQFILDNDKGIVLNQMLRENLLTLFICINNREPLIIIGKPGSGKTLSVNCVANSMKGEFSDSEFLQRRNGLLIYRYQGTKNTSSKSITRAFKIVRSSIDIFKKNNEGIKLIPIFFFDEMGFAQRSDNLNNPLKVLHTELEYEYNVNKHDKIVFVGISNWQLDSAKMNRALYLLISDPDENELLETAKNIGYLMNRGIFLKYIKLFIALVKAYSEYKKLDLNKEFGKDINKNESNIYSYLNDFHGNRDFYYFIKNTMNDLIEEDKNLNENDPDMILYKVGIKNIERNFGGLSIEVIDKLKQLFYAELPECKKDKINSKYNPISFIENNLNSNNKNTLSRYLMLLNNSPINEFLIKSLLKYINNKNAFFILKGSPFLDSNEEEGNYYRKKFMRKFEELSTENNIIIMKDLENIYPTLFNLFDKNFIKLKDKDIYSNTDLLFEINPNMKIIILTNHKKLTKENLPFINRFEKHIISINNILKQEYIDLGEKIWNQLMQIVTFNKNKNLKINLKEMLIIKYRDEISCLIYKIINMEKNISNNIDIEKEIYKILVPTFSQDLIISIKYSSFEKKNKKLCEYIYQIYQEKYRYNFIDFLNKIKEEKNLKNNKYIIYTFSDICSLRKLLKKKTEYNNLIVNEKIIDDIKSDKDLDKLLENIYKENNENLLIFHFGENDIYKMEYITYKINQKEIELNDINNNSQRKIIFIIHLKRKKILKENNEENIPLYCYNNLLLNLDENDNNYYEHLFIDNLLSNEDYFISFILAEKNNEIKDIIKSILNINSFFNKYLYQIFAYFSYEFYNESEFINKNNYMKKTILELTNGNSNNILIEYIKEKIIEIIIEQSTFNIKNIIPKIYLSNNYFRNDDVDFFELISSYIYSSFKSTLFQIINILEKNNILSPIITTNYNILNENKISLYKKILEEFFKKIDINSYSKPKEEYNANKIKIILGLNIPISLLWIKEFKNQFLIEQNIINRYKNNERLFIDNKDNIDNEKEYFFEYNKLIKNGEEQLKKNIYINNIIANSNNSEIKKELIYDFIKIYISDLSNKFTSDKNKSIKYNYSLIIDFISIILSLKFGKNNIIEEISFYDCEKYLNNISSIILFLEGFNYEILSLSEIFIILSNYIQNLYKKLLAQINIKDTSNKSNSFNAIFTLIINALIEIIFNNYNDMNNLNIFALYQFFEKMKYIKIIIEKINNKISSKNNNIDILNTLDILLIIYEFATKKNDNSELFQKFLINVTQNLNEEITIIKKNDNDKLIENIIDLGKILEKKFSMKNKEENVYYFIMNKIYRIYFNRIDNEDIKFFVMKKTFENNNQLNSDCIYLLNFIFNIKFDYNGENFFAFFDKEKDNKYLLYLENINNEIFYQILLYYFELFFNQIFSENNNDKDNYKYNYTHLKQAFNYITVYIDTKLKYNFGNIVNIYTIAFIKVFIDNISKKYLNDESININEFISLVNSNEIGDDIRYIIKIYFFKCVYFNNKDLDNINKLNNYITTKENFPFKDDYIKYHNQIEKEKFIFEYCFIPMNNIDIYYQEKNLIKEKNYLELNYNFFNKESFDVFYCLFINHIFSPIFSHDLTNNTEKLIFDNFIKEFEINILSYKIPVSKINKEYIKIFKNLYNKKILEKCEIKSQNQIEILFYSIRFVLCLYNSNPKNNFFSSLIKEKDNNTYEIISSSYIPGTTPFNNVYLNSYFALKELMPITNENEFGFYICSCGQYYTLGKCTCPAYQFNCQNCGLIIGGIGHYLEEREDHFRLYLNKEKFNENVFARDEVISNKIPYMFFDEYKKKYIDKYLLNEPKGINKEDIAFFIERKNYNIRSMSEITFRILNFILYSFLLMANFLDKISDENLNKLTPGNYTCFKCVEKDWEIIDIILKEKGINNIQIFFNIIFNDITSLIKNCENFDTKEKRKNFEENVNKYINELIDDKNLIKGKIDEYKKYNEKIKNSEPHYIDEIINENYPPIELYYNKNKFPYLNFFMKSTYPDINILYNELSIINNYANKYPLLNQVIINNEEFRLLYNLTNINKLSNKLLKKYCYKISRDEAQNISLYFPSQKETEILLPYIQSWNEIKKFCVRYQCRPDMPILNLDKKMPLNFFLVDDGQLGGGMYLAAAYSNFIEWQNKFINLILDNINQNSPLYCYVEQLNEEILVQDAKEDNVLKLNKSVFEKLNLLIKMYSMRNIIENNCINYNNYRRIKFNFDEIEIELAKIILPGLKKFKSNDDPIKFMVYLYEGNRSHKSQILMKFENKYPSKELNEKEKRIIYNFIKKYENSRKILNEIFFSCQILIDYIQKENYNKLNSIFDIINELPNFIEINNFLKKFFSENKNFSINMLLNIYKYFEHFCWKEIRVNINEQYQEKIDKNKKIEIINFFKNLEKEKNDNLITKKDLAFALRRFISRYLAGKRGDTDIDEKQKLIGQIVRYDLWDNNIIKNDEKFQNEIYYLTFDLNVGQALDFYDVLDGDSFDIFDIKEIKDENEDDNNNYNINIIIEEKNEINNENKNKIESIIKDIL